MSDLTVPNLADTIRDKVRQTIVATIPDEQINVLIKKEWDSFFDIPTPKERWQTKPERSGFQLMVRKEVEDYINTKIHECVRLEIDRFNQATWDAQGKQCIKNIIAEYTPDVISGLSELVVVNALNKMRT